MDDIAMVDTNEPVRSRPRFLRTLRTGERSGQAIVEFAIVSVAFFTIVFGTIDFGRAIFMYSELSNAVREGARYGKINPSDSAGIQQTIRDKAPSLGGTDASSPLLTVENPVCVSGSYPDCTDVTVSASYRFIPLVARYLGVGEITLKASAAVETD